MLANQRQQVMQEQLKIHHSVKVSELANLLHVSAETIRRDLEDMEKRNLLSRVHGGAVSLNRKYHLEDVNVRVTANIELKQQLSETALSYVHDGDVIAIDSGSTASIFALALKERQFDSLSIITYSSEVFSILSDCLHYKITLAGGDYLPKERVFCGYFTNKMMSKLYYSKAFIVPSAVSLDYGAHDFITEVYENQQSMIQHANDVFILADSTKFERTGNLKLCDLQPEYTIITDKHLPNAIYKNYLEHNVNLIY